MDTSVPIEEITLISSDGRQRRVHYLFLSQASPYFRNAKSNITPQTSTIPPSLSVDETAETLDYLLQYIYPQPIQRTPTTSSEAVTFFLGAKKLQIETAIPEVRGQLRQLTDGDPNQIRSWAIAMRLDLDEERCSAYQKLLGTDLDIFNNNLIECADELRHISGFELMKLCSWYLSEAQAFLPRSFRAWIPGMRSEAPASSTNPTPSPIRLALSQSSTSDLLTYPDGDVILHSSDDAKLCVHAFFLSHVSDVLKQNIESAIRPGKPTTVVLDETGEILNVLMRYIYRTPQPGAISTLDSLLISLAAARRLGVEVAVSPLTSKLREEIKALLNPIRAWSILVRTETDVAQSATMLRILVAGTRELKKWLDKRPPELVWVSGLQLSQLLRWRLQNREQAYRVILGGFVEHYGQENREPTEEAMRTLQQDPERVEREVGVNPWEWNKRTFTLDDPSCKHQVQRVGCHFSKFTLSWKYELGDVQGKLRAQYETIEEQLRVGGVNL